MFNSNNTSGMSRKFLDRMFKQVGGLVWDLTTGNLGIQDQHGIHTLEKISIAVATDTAAEQFEYNISVNPMEAFGISIPAFATQVTHDKINLSDLIIGDQGILGWVVDKKPSSLVLLDKNGMRKQYTPPKVAIMGGTGALVVQSLGNLTGNDGLGGLQSSLLPLLMMGEGNVDLNKILPLLLFTQTQGGGNSAMQSLMPILMMSSMSGSNGSSLDKMLPLLMMGGMGGAGASAGISGMNPMMLAMMMGQGETLPLSSIPASVSSNPVPPLLKRNR